MIRRLFAVVVLGGILALFSLIACTTHNNASGDADAGTGCGVSYSPPNRDLALSKNPCSGPDLPPGKSAPDRNLVEQADESHVLPPGIYDAFDLHSPYLVERRLVLFEDGTFVSTVIVAQQESRFGGVVVPLTHSSGKYAAQDGVLTLEATCSAHESDGGFAQEDPSARRWKYFTKDLGCYGFVLNLVSEDRSKSIEDALYSRR